MLNLMMDQVKRWVRIKGKKVVAPNGSTLLAGYCFGRK